MAILFKADQDLGGDFIEYIRIKKPIFKIFREEEL